MLEKITVRIDRDLEEIVPGYLDNRRRDLLLLPEALTQENFDDVRVMGHRMKGSGAGYGFDGITEIGRAIEEAAKVRDAGAVRSAVVELASYLDRVEVTYE